MSEPLPFPKETALALLRDMLRIRRLEEKAYELYGQGKIRGFLHLYIGEEAVATGVLASLTMDDNVLTTYREHGHALVRGVTMQTIMAEMYGKFEGCSEGRGGSMHIFDAAKRFYGGSAIVGGHLPMAVGMALAAKMRGEQRVSAVFFGEGAMAEGAFHESLNLAALWQLPVLFVCENNGYAMGTALERSQSQTDLCAKAAAYKVDARRTDGMDVAAVWSAARDAVTSVREAGHGPVFLECKTYRFRAHSMFDAELYRDKKEVEVWKARDPLKTFAARLRDERMLDDAAWDAMEGAVAGEVDDAVTFAEGGTWEPVADLGHDVYRREDHG